MPTQHSSGQVLSLALAVVIVLTTIVLILVRRARIDKVRKSPEFEEGRLAYSNTLKGDNPYTGINKTKECNWSAGWDKARAERETYEAVKQRSQQSVSERGLGCLPSLIFLGALIGIPLVCSEENNKELKTDYRWDSVSFPEQSGLLGGWVGRDTLELNGPTVVMKKHGLFGSKTVTVPASRIKKLIIGSFLGQKYVQVEYEEGILGSSYRIYTIDNSNVETIRQYFENKTAIIETN
jgi:hypothetical protein